MRRALIAVHSATAQSAGTSTTRVLYPGTSFGRGHKRPNARLLCRLCSNYHEALARFCSDAAPASIGAQSRTPTTVRRPTDLASKKVVLPSAGSRAGGPGRGWTSAAIRRESGAVAEPAKDALQVDGRASPKPNRRLATMSATWWHRANHCVRHHARGVLTTAVTVCGDTWGPATAAPGECAQ